MHYLESLREIFPELEVRRGIPEVTIISTAGHCLLILDDLADILYANAEMGSMFIRNSHHDRISVVYPTFLFLKADTNLIFISDHHDHTKSFSPRSSCQEHKF